MITISGNSDDPPQPAIARRTVLGFIASAFSCPNPALAAARFWDAKPASQWSPEEVAQLVVNSPWAKRVPAQYRVSMDDGSRPAPGHEPQPGRGEAQAGECGLVPCSAIMPGNVAVIWESAQPVREAIHPVIPPEFNGRYVISVRGLAGDYSYAMLAAGSDLSAKGKPPVQPGIVRQRNSTYLFGFSKELMPLDAADKDVQFNVRTGASLSATLVHASFNPKEMTYRGVLAL